jgi:hypothetical protein
LQQGLLLLLLALLLGGGCCRLQCRLLCCCCLPLCLLGRLSSTPGRLLLSNLGQARCYMVCIRANINSLNNSQPLT